MLQISSHVFLNLRTLAIRLDKKCKLKNFLSSVSMKNVVLSPIHPSYLIL